ncbi:MAG: bifunctional hydroxymethylpyrimidine kinase/phosphomethylpyrimidine kinase [Halobacteriales archaeon]
MKPDETPVALSIAGSDSGGGAGVQADVKAMEAHGVLGTSAITSLTAQNTRGVTGVLDVEPDFVRSQIDAVVEDLAVASAKTGMLSNADVARAVADAVRDHELTTVVDPVMVAESGDRLLEPEAEEVVRTEVVPRATLVTPNAREAEALTDVAVDDADSAVAAGERLLELGADAALVKGGHLTGDRVVDVLVTSDGAVEHVKPRVDTRDTHGTGCTLSAAIAAEIAKGERLEDAVATAEETIHRAITYAHDVGGGAGPVDHLAPLRNRAGRAYALDEVRRAIAEFEAADVSRVVPEVGLNYAVASPRALDETDVAAVEGRLRRTNDGVEALRPALAASGHVARFLLEVRRHRAVEAACNVRNDAGVRKALDELGLKAVEFDRESQPRDVREGEGGTMEWSASQVDDSVDAVVDAGAHGKEAMVRLVGDADDVRERVVALAGRADDTGA